MRIRPQRLRVGDGGDLLSAAVSIGGKATNGQTGMVAMALRDLQNPNVQAILSPASQVITGAIEQGIASATGVNISDVAGQAAQAIASQMADTIVGEVGTALVSLGEVPIIGAALAIIGAIMDAVAGIHSAASAAGGTNASNFATYCPAREAAGGLQAPGTFLPTGAHGFVPADYFAPTYRWNVIQAENALDAHADSWVPQASYTGRPFIGTALIKATERTVPGAQGLMFGGWAGDPGAPHGGINADWLEAPSESDVAALTQWHRVFGGEPSVGISRDRSLLYSRIRQAIERQWASSQARSNWPMDEITQVNIAGLPGISDAALHQMAADTVKRFHRGLRLATSFFSFEKDRIEAAIQSTYGNTSGFYYRDKYHPEQFPMNTQPAWVWGPPPRGTSDGGAALFAAYMDLLADDWGNGWHGNKTACTQSATPRLTSAYVRTMVEGWVPHFVPGGELQGQQGYVGNGPIVPSAFDVPNLQDPWCYLLCGTPNTVGQITEMVNQWITRNVCPEYESDIKDAVEQRRAARAAMKKLFASTHPVVSRSDAPAMPGSSVLAEVEVDLGKLWRGAVRAIEGK